MKLITEQEIEARAVGIAKAIGNPVVLPLPVPQVHYEDVMVFLIRRVAELQLKLERLEATIAGERNGSATGHGNLGLLARQMSASGKYSTLPDVTNPLEPLAVGQVWEGVKLRSITASGAVEEELVPIRLVDRGPDGRWYAEELAHLLEAHCLAEATIRTGKMRPHG